MGSSQARTPQELAGRGQRLNCPFPGRSGFGPGSVPLESMPHPSRVAPAPPAPLTQLAWWTRGWETQVPETQGPNLNRRPCPPTWPLTHHTGEAGRGVPAVPRRAHGQTSSFPAAILTPSPCASGLKVSRRSLEALADPRPCRDLWFCLHTGRQRHEPPALPSAEGPLTGLEVGSGGSGSRSSTAPPCRV